MGHGKSLQGGCKPTSSSCVCQTFNLWHCVHFTGTLRFHVHFAHPTTKQWKNSIWLVTVVTFSLTKHDPRCVCVVTDAVFRGNGSSGGLTQVSKGPSCDTSYNCLCTEDLSEISIYFPTAKKQSFTGNRLVWSKRKKKKESIIWKWKN